jgi:hypothetical protein
MEPKVRGWKEFMVIRGLIMHIRVKTRTTYVYNAYLCRGFSINKLIVQQKKQK